MLKGLAAGCVVLWVGAGAAQAIGFNFEGDSPAFSFHGYFEAMDDDGDGFIRSDEVSQFSARFQGDWYSSGGVPDYEANSSWGDSFAIIYQLGSGIVSDMQLGLSRTYPCEVLPGGAGTRSVSFGLNVAGNMTTWDSWGGYIGGNPSECSSYAPIPTGGGSFEQIVHVTSDPTPSSPVPLPAGLPLLLTGLGAVAVFRRRARRA